MAIIYALGAAAEVAIGMMPWPDGRDIVWQSTVDAVIYGCAAFFALMSIRASAAAE